MKKKQLSLPLTPQTEILLSVFESEAEIARVLDVTPQYVNAWIKRGYTPPAYAIRLEELTDGKIKAKDLVKPHKKSR